MGPPGMEQRVELTPSQRQAMEQTMTQTHQQMEQLHNQVRTKLLGALTPAHRSLLAQVIGQLAIAPNPDRDAAVRQLNAALSPGEAQAIIAAHTAAMTQMHSIMEAAHQRMQTIFGEGQKTQQSSNGHTDQMWHGPPGGPQMHAMGQLTAGDILLHLAGSDLDSHMPMMEFHHSGN